MEVEEDLSSLTVEERLMKEYERTKRVPKGKKLVSEEVTEIDAKGYLVTKTIKKFVDAEPAKPIKKLDLTIKSDPKTKPNAKKALVGKQMNMMAFMKAT